MRDDTSSEETMCQVCGRVMTRIQACHLRCMNCGAELDCSDKGPFW